MKPHPEAVADSVSHADMAAAIRFLSADAVEKAKSGHPGMPMGMADAATVLFTRFLKFDPRAPRWPDRDRFVLSAGHGSMLLYSLLYLTGYEDMTIDELKAFRQLGSRTAGHPEYGHASGIETTTGPLGQGLSNAVGMALAERLLNARLGDSAVDHHTYALAGDGCLMEGISQEAISLAGHLKLGKLVVLWDDNRISIDGATDLATSEDQQGRFKAAGWHVQTVDGHDPEAVAAAITAARTEVDKPSMIACRTTIGWGAPTKAGSEKTHGAPLGAEEIAGMRKALGWPHEPFHVPDAILNAWRAVGARGAEQRHAWEERQKALTDDQRRMLEGRLADDGGAVFDAFIAKVVSEKPKWATRKASQEVLEAITPPIPELIGGSADLTHSNLTVTKATAPVRPGDFAGRYIHYGVREHAMGAVMNGIALHGGFIPYGGTFLVFTDYLRPALRLSALMGRRVIYVMTHDSIGLGEDGPTHQPIEHLVGLRAMPNLLVMRPCDPVETAECWKIALAQDDRPSVLALSRQGVPTVRERSDETLSARGAYVLAEAEGPRAVTLIATGTEVCLALDARKALAEQGIAAAVVSMPCWELFDEQPESYRAQVLGPEEGLRVAVEAGGALGWERYVGRGGVIIGMRSFGASAPGGDLYRHFGFTPEAVADAVRARIKT